MKLPVTVALVVCALASLHLVADDEETLTQKVSEVQLKQRNQDKNLIELSSRLSELTVQLKETQNLVNTLSKRLQLTQIEPVDELFNHLESTQENEAYRYDETRGFIGVHFGEVTDTGVLITRVIEGGPANIAGIEADDVISKINDVQVLDFDEPMKATSDLIKSHPPGSIIRITLSRNDKEMSLDVATLRRSSIAFDESVALESDSVLRTLTEQMRTLLREHQAEKHPIYIMQIEEDFGHYFGVKNGVIVLSAVEIEDIQAGDVLLRIDNRRIRTISQALQHLQAADDEVSLLVKRNNREEQVTLEKDTFKFQRFLKY